MRWLFSINGAGGPLLCMDSRAAVGWRGVDDGSSDYARLCADLDAQPDFSAGFRSFNGGEGVVWEMNGGGTADVFLGDDGSLVVVRGWFDEYSEALVEQLARAPATAHVSLGDLLVPSGALALFWAPESSPWALRDVAGEWLEIDDASMGGTSFLVKVAHERFTCADERTVIGETSARRLVLEGVRSGTTSS